MQENEFYATNRAFMDTKRDLCIDLHTDVVDVLKASWICGQVTSHTFPVPVIVGRDDNDFLSELLETK